MGNLHGLWLILRLLSSNSKDRMSHVLALHGIGLGPVGGEASQSSEHAGCRVASCDGNSARCHVRSPDANLHWAGWNRDGDQSWKLLPGLFSITCCFLLLVLGIWVPGANLMPHLVSYLPGSEVTQVLLLGSILTAQCVVLYFLYFDRARRWLCS